MGSVVSLRGIVGEWRRDAGGMGLREVVDDVADVGGDWMWNFRSVGWDIWREWYCGEERFVVWRCGEVS